MERLSDNWITEGWIDFEYKKYILLAYMKHVSGQFKEVKLYPPLAELIHHYTRLKGFAESKEQLNGRFPKQLQGPDWEAMKLNYKPVLVDDALMKQLTEIVDFSMPKFQKAIEEGKNIYDFLESEMKIEPVGISPLYQREGYAMLTHDASRDIYIYRYKVSLFQQASDTLKGIMMQLIRRVKRSFAHTFEHIKLELVKSHQDLPNPATFRIHSKYQIPMNESFLPITKRILLKAIQD
ncbi:hypothetical protein [Mongoliitalea daihaiensis]|uniref:hypothetical protein n=1 Tax=Mongoliitalea daihaiensis TaxID=2782006 RepID=UPI001F40CA36|nr:hypothetical protein [Mongoliitalea daihaiensis]UJP63564.1 hypothetical protein IPZ59_12015 [Mongoliitalea daihaiensis]